MADSLKKIGSYSLKGGVKFWPIAPGTTVDQFDSQPAQPSQVAPTNVNILTIPPEIGILDIIIEFSHAPDDFPDDDPDALDEEDITEEDLNDELYEFKTGKPPESSASLVRNDVTANISFAAAIPKDKHAFEGTLVLEVKLHKNHHAVKVELPIKVAERERAADMYIFFVAHKKPPVAYCWFQTKVVDQSDGATPVGEAKVLLKVLRDNQQSGFATINRRVELTSLDDGSVVYGADRKVIAMPIDWPHIFNVFADAYVQRGHMVRFKKDQCKNNLEAIHTSDITMMKIGEVDLSNTRILLDPGHGVVYGHKARRCQEWYVAQKVADAVTDKLTTVFGMPAENIVWTRSAGFGLIAPNEVHRNDAPERGDKRYKFDLPKRRIRALTNAISLKNISDLLLTTHDYNNEDPLPVSEDDRNRIIAVSSLTIEAIVERLNDHLHAQSRRVRPDSVRWDTSSDTYVYTQEKTNAQPGEDPVVHLAQPFPITTDDWFDVDDAMFYVLAERSASWSLYCEIGSGPQASGKRPAFAQAARWTMEGTGALPFMRDRILSFIAVEAPHPYLDYGIKGWGPSNRIKYFKKLNDDDPCDLYVSFHENAGGGIGGTAMVSGKPGADAPPDEQIKIDKIFVKYVDGFDHGTRTGGISKEDPTNPADMFHHQNPIRRIHPYLEMEFMDTVDPSDDSQYQYQQMVTDAWIQPMAEQITAAIIETLFGVQTDLDPIRYKSQLTLW
jgi:hypothetical protein